MSLQNEKKSADAVQEGLTVLDASGDRLFVIPADVRGFFRRYRNFVEAILILFFLAVPWTQVNGLQTIWLDVSERRFTLFGMVFWAHDGPLLFFIFGILTLGMAFLTTVWGRIWCGWACPQTVFIDGIFRRIEAFVEGSYIQRRQMLTEPLTFIQTVRKIIKWFLFILVSSVIAHSFIAYFAGSKNLLDMIQHSPKDNWTYFILITVMTGLLAFNFGWFREQFCIIMCPYGRFQSVLMDQKTLTVMYDEQRTDCVQCKRCIQVCPTRIDIRQGLQMECIACTSCIDACDEIMDKVKKPRGLLGYKTLDRLPFKVLRARSTVYLSLIFIFTSSLIFSLWTRNDFEMIVLRTKDTAYEVTKDSTEDKITNHLKLHIRNQTFSTKKVRLQASTKDNIEFLQVIMAQPEIQLEPGEMKMIHFFIRFPRSLTEGSGKKWVRFELVPTESLTKNLLSAETEFQIVGPY